MDEETRRKILPEELSFILTFYLLLTSLASITPLMGAVCVLSTVYHHEDKPVSKEREKKTDVLFLSFALLILRRVDEKEDRLVYMG